MILFVRPGTSKVGSRGEKWRHHKWSNGVAVPGHQTREWRSDEHNKRCYKRSTETEWGRAAVLHEARQEHRAAAVHVGLYRCSSGPVLELQGTCLYTCREKFSHLRQTGETQ